MIEDGVRPLQDALAFGREAVESLPALDDGNAEFLFELTDSARERWLGDVTGVSRAGEVLFPGQGNEVLKLANVHEPVLKCSGA